MPRRRDVAAVIAKDARENLAGVDVISVGPLYAEQASGGVQYSVVVIVPEPWRKGLCALLRPARHRARPIHGHRLPDGPSRLIRTGKFLPKTGLRTTRTRLFSTRISPLPGPGESGRSVRLLPTSPKSVTTRRARSTQSE